MQIIEDGYGGNDDPDMEDTELVELAFDILEDTDVIEEFETTVWLKVEREIWEKLKNNGGLL